MLVQLETVYVWFEGQRHGSKFTVENVANVVSVTFIEGFLVLWEIDSCYFVCRALILYVLLVFSFTHHSRGIRSLERGNSRDMTDSLSQVEHKIARSAQNF